MTKGTTWLRIAMAFSLLAAAAPAAAGQSKLTENTIGLDEGGVREPASIQDLAWLAGYWRGEGLGGLVEEVWTVPEAGAMIGLFRLIREGKTSFSEALQLAKDGESLVMRVKHFTPDFVGWEEKDHSVEFPLVKIEGKTAYFRGLTIRLTDPETLELFLVLTNKEGQRREEAFLLKKFR